MTEHQIYQVLTQHAVWYPNVAKAQAELLGLPAIAKFYRGLKSTKEQEDFKKHMQKYISIWLPECPFEVSTTNRYTITTYEAATTARRKIESGETIKYLCGNLVAMTPEEEEELDLNRRDFSVVRTVRKKTTSLFLGPARFANHDCMPNARLCQQGEEGMTIIARRDIQLGEEITVDYGDHYFGANNKECLCATCEKKGRNGWAPKEECDVTIMSPSSGSSKASPSQSRSRERIEKSDDDRSKSAKLSKPLRAGLKRDLSTGLNTPPESTEKASTLSEADIGDCDVDISGDELDTNARRTPRRRRRGQRLPRRKVKVEQSSGAQRPSKASSMSKLDMLAKTASADHAPAKYIDQWLGGTMGQTKLKTHTSVWMRPSLNIFATAAASNSVHCPGDYVNVQKLRGRSSLPLRTMTPFGDTSTLQGSSRGSLGRKHNDLTSARPRLLTPQDSDDIEGTEVLGEEGDDGEGEDSDSDLSESSDSSNLSGKIPRKPGDYIRTRALLVVRQARWVDCGTCDIPWVEIQEHTRVECPRCERHSKIYGYRWPKTVKRGENDAERVTDHRLINRTLKYHEEKAYPRRGHGLEKPATPEETKAMIEASSDEDDDEPRRLRRTQARDFGNGKKRPLEEMDHDPRLLESKNKKIRAGKGWYMLVE